MAMRCIADDYQPQIMDTKGEIARRMRSSRKRCVYPMSQHHNRAQRSPCGRVHLASSLRSAGELRLLGRRSSSTFSVNARSETCCDGGGCYEQRRIDAAGFVRSH